MKKNKFWKNINYNKWKYNAPDCQIRSICAGLGFDYEAACKKLNVKCTPGKGYTNNYGVDLDVIYNKFKPFFGKMYDMLDQFDDPIQALTNGITLNEWLDEHTNDMKSYLVYLDDNKELDGGHIVCARCKGPEKTFFVDTFDCGNMFVQAYIEIKKVVAPDSDLHWKYDQEKKQFI